jgi:hypothetical protein
MVGSSDVRLMPMSCGDGEGVGDGEVDGVGDGLVEGVGDGLVEGVGDGLVEGVGDGDGPIDGDGDALTTCLLSTASDPAHEALAAQKPASNTSANARIRGDRIDDSPMRCDEAKVAMEAAD